MEEDGLDCIDVCCHRHQANCLSPAYFHDSREHLPIIVAALQRRNGHYLQHVPTAQSNKQTWRCTSVAHTP